MAERPITEMADGNGGKRNPLFSSSYYNRYKNSIFKYKKFKEFNLNLK